MSQVRARFAAAAIALVAALGLSLATDTAALAAPRQGWIYISTPQWLGNCVDGKNNGPVTGLLMAVGDTYSSRSWDRGDDIVYAKVNLGQRQQVSLRRVLQQAVAGAVPAGHGAIHNANPRPGRRCGSALPGALQLAPLRLAELRSSQSFGPRRAGSVVSPVLRGARAARKSFGP